MKGTEAFGIRVMKATEWEASVSLIGEPAAQQRKDEAAMVPWILFGIPVAYTREDVAALMLAHVSWPVVVKGNPMKGKGKTHRWRVLSGATPNYDFV